ncbi:MAG: hypothetical protein KF703_15980 [Actinobacteria bacterium]|nr:hypothetical protein [Actinomycetota bacterium]
MTDVPGLEREVFRRTLLGTVIYLCWGLAGLAIATTATRHDPWLALFGIVGVHLLLDALRRQVVIDHLAGTISVRRPLRTITVPKTEVDSVWVPNKGPTSLVLSRSSSVILGKRPRSINTGIDDHGGLRPATDRPDRLARALGVPVEGSRYYRSTDRTPLRDPQVTWDPRSGDGAMTWMLTLMLVGLLGLIAFGIGSLVLG